MKRKPVSRAAFFNTRILLGFGLCFLALVLALFGIDVSDQAQGQGLSRRPRELSAARSAHSFDGDLRQIRFQSVTRKERPEREPPPFAPRLYQPTGVVSSTTTSVGGPATLGPAITAPAPGPTTSFDGLDFANWGAGHPPDENGDVGPAHYIQVVNTSIGIFDKTTGARVAAFTFDTFMSQGHFGNLCDTDNFGDPVVLYDSFADRWIITDFAFKLDGLGNVINPPGSFQCFAVSKSGDPVNGGWNYYSINTTGGLGDYPKFGIWIDGLYMSVNMFDYSARGSFQNPRVYAFNTAQMYAGMPTAQVVQFNAPPADFTLLPGDARLQTGTPPPGTPNYFISTWEFLNALTVYKLHVDWDHIALSTFNGPDIPATGSSWPNQSVGNAATPANDLDTLGIRAMARNHYTNLGGAESLWTTHTVRRATNGFATPRWYQVDVTGGSVAANTTQTATWDPDGANVTYRYVPSLAIDRSGDMAIGYSTSNSTTDPGIMYAGRLAADPLNTFSQTEQLLFQGTGSQLGNCGSSTCLRWGDYTAMVLDPVDGCTFWYTNEYYAANGLNDQTRIGAFKYSQCTPLGNGGNVSGQVNDSSTGNPISGASVTLGSGRTTSTDVNGSYSFNGIPAGTYPSITASAAGYNSASNNSVVVTDNTTTTENFALTVAPTPTPTPTATPTPIPMVQVTVQTNPAGLGFTVDGTSYSSTQMFNWPSGSSHTIATSSPQKGATGVRYVWSKWSDSGAISHTVAPTINKTYTATFAKQYFLTMNAGTGGKVSPNSGWRSSGAVVSISATPTNNSSVSYSFTGWSGTGTGSYSGTNNPASTTMNGPITETATFTQNPVQVTVQTNPAGLSFSVDGISYTAAQSFSWDPGSSHTIGTTSPQSAGTGIQYVWNNWSDNGTITHTVAPTTNKTYTAKFTTQFFLTMSAGTGGTVTPVSGWKNSGAAVSITAKPSTGFSFSTWSGSGTGSFSGSTNPVSITMGGPITEAASFTHN